MKLLALLLFISFNSFSQIDKGTSVSGSVPGVDFITPKRIPINEYQLSIINDLQKQIAEKQKELNRALELITGIKQEQIQDLQFEPEKLPTPDKSGVFVITLKKKE